MRLDKQFIICGSRRYGHAAGIFGAGLGTVLATSWAALHPCAQALACWLVVEAAFYLQQLWRYHHLSSARVTDAAIDPHRQRIVEDRLLDLGAVFGIQEFLSGWFKGAPFEAIKRENMVDFIAYGFSCKRVDQLTPAERQHADEYTQRVETTFGVRFEEGRNEDLEFMAHLWEPLRWIHKPLALYLGAELMWLATDAVLYAQGFRPHWHDGLRYWIMQPLVVREPAAAAEAALQQGAGQSVGSSGCASSVMTSSEASPFASSSCSSGAASPGAVAEGEGTTVRGPNAAAMREQLSQPLNGGSMAAATFVSPVTLAAQTLRRLVRRRRLNVWDSVSSLRKLTPRPGRAASDSAPIFFIHGVGFGLTPYLHFVAELMRAFPTRPMVLLEARHVSVCLHTHCHSTDAMAAATAAILAKHGWRQAAFMGHSYGTFVLSRIAQLHRPLVQSMVLLDPVCMLTIYPQLLRNFVYKLPDFWSAHMLSLLGLVDSLRFIFSRDLMVAESFCRKFVWHRECLWPEDLPDAAMLVLAANDDLVPSALVRAMLTKLNHPCEVMYHPTAGHGGFLLSHSWRRQIVKNIKATVATGADLAAKEGKAQ